MVIIFLGIFILSIVLNIMRIYYVRKRGYFLNIKTKERAKFDKDLENLLK
tara:strand:+ start:656 stop:805 length:150 start_codon:yes stop_codon:yes gene_type:complete